VAGGGVSAWLYVLECGDGSLYTGWTNRLEKRLLAHEKGVGGKFTRSRLPVRLVAAWRKRSEKEARSAEVYFKQLSRGEKMERVGRASTKSLPTRVRARVGKRSAN